MVALAPSREYVPPFTFAVAHAALGNLDQAFAALERGVAERDALMSEYFFEATLDPPMGDPRYAKFAALIRG
jgi:hypothetical protein